MVVHWNVMHVNADVFRAQCSEKLRAIPSEFLQLQLNRIHVLCRVHLRPDRWRNHAAHFAKGSAVARGDFPPSLQVTIKSLQLFDSERTSDVGQAVVETEQYYFVVPLPRALPLARVTRHAVIAKTSQRLCQPGIV